MSLEEIFAGFRDSVACTLYSCLAGNGHCPQSTAGLPDGLQDSFPPDPLALAFLECGGLEPGLLPTVPAIS